MAIFLGLTYVAILLLLFYSASACVLKNYIGAYFGDYPIASLHVNRRRIIDWGILNILGSPFFLIWFACAATSILLVITEGVGGIVSAAGMHGYIAPTIGLVVTIALFRPLIKHLVNQQCITDELKLKLDHGYLFYLKSQPEPIYGITIWQNNTFMLIRTNDNCQLYRLDDIKRIEPNQKTVLKEVEAPTK